MPAIKQTTTPNHEIRLIARRFMVTAWNLLAPPFKARRLAHLRLVGQAHAVCCYVCACLVYDSRVHRQHYYHGGNHPH